VAALQAASPALVAALIRPLVATSPSDLAVGGCHYAELTAEPRWRLPVRRLLTHGTPRVRLCAAQAMAAMGGAADLSALERAGSDPCVQVREASTAAVAAVTDREG
jgi:hypothetical protein